MMRPVSDVEDRDRTVSTDAARAARFEEERPRLVGLAYRMLGSVSDAQDVVQDAWLRLERTDLASIDSPAAWLTTVVTRLALDQLRRQHRQREDYVGPWLPEPVLADAEATAMPDPARQAELADSLTTAFLLLLEELSPTERAVVLLADVFDEPFDSIAEVIGRSPAATRQLASRARRRLRERPRQLTTGAERAGAPAFMAAGLADGRDAMLAMVVDDIVAVSDGGANVHAARRPVVGPDRVVRFVANLVQRFARFPGLDVGAATVNGRPGIVVHFGGQVVLVASVHVEEGKVVRVESILNPDKLARVDGHVHMI